MPGTDILPLASTDPSSFDATSAESEVFEAVAGASLGSAATGGAGAGAGVVTEAVTPNAGTGIAADLVLRPLVSSAVV